MFKKTNFVTHEVTNVKFSSANILIWKHIIPSYVIRTLNFDRGATGCTRGFTFNKAEFVFGGKKKDIE